MNCSERLQVRRKLLRKRVWAVAAMLGTFALTGNALAAETAAQADVQDEAQAREQAQAGEEAEAAPKAETNQKAQSVTDAAEDIDVGVADAANGARLIVSTQQGMYVGTRHKTVHSFKGIPFAAPPVGELRWRPPQLPAKHQGITAATALGPACLQVGIKRDSSEDCLSLNIWTADPGAKRPVMVWIHGGGLRVGSNDIAGDVFANSTLDNPAVVVSINYRLGPLGFFSHRSLKGKHANFAVLDMIAALKWVQANIEAFGGDKDNVTLFGVSAGGMAVNMMLTTRLSKGLFHRAIVQSGYGTWPLQHTRHARGTAALDMDGTVQPTAESSTRALVQKITQAEQTREVLYSLTGKDLIEALDGFQLPYVDGQSLKAEPAIVFARNQHHRLPLIIGGNSNEGTVMPGSGITVEWFANSFSSVDARVRKLYAPDFAESDVAGWQRVFGDNRYLLAAKVQGDLMARSAAPTWMYYIDFVPSQFKGQWKGTPHGSDAWFLFSGLDSDDPEISTFARAMQRYWLNFAHTGDPNESGTQDWPAHTEANDVWLRMGEENRAETGPIADKLELLVQRHERRTTPGH